MKEQVQSHEINEEEASVVEMLSWVKVQESLKGQKRKKPGHTKFVVSSKKNKVKVFN